MIAVDYFKPSLSSWISLKTREINRLADDLIARFNVVTPSSKSQTGHLSGGNIQRLIVGRELGSERATVVIASQPTRGIDIAGTEAIRRNLIDYANRGAGVLLVSADLDEVLALSDRVIVLYEGRVFDAGYYDEGIRKRVGDYMTGLSEEGCTI
jgi:simple sugar transport system ATP-binding protein